MKLYTGQGVHPLRVEIFIAEKKLDMTALGMERVDISFDKEEHRSDAYRRINSLGQLPALELDDGTIITESMAICRYLEEISPAVPLYGTDATSRALVEMWNRRMEQQIFFNIGSIALHSHEFFKHSVKQVPEFAAAQREFAPTRLAWLDGELADGRAFVAGDNFSTADIIGMSALALLGFVGLELPASFKHATAWATRVTSRPSWPYPPL